MLCRDCQVVARCVLFSSSARHLSSLESGGDTMSIRKCLMVGVLLLVVLSFALLATKYASSKIFITELKGAANGLMALISFVTGVLALKREPKKPPRRKRRTQSSFEPRVSRSTFSFEGGVFGGLI